MLQLKMTARGLAERIGFSYGSTKNLILGAPCSDRAKQLITNTLSVEIWPGVSVTERRVTLPAGVEIELDTEAEAISAEREFAGFIKRTGAKIKFVKPAPATIGHETKSHMTPHKELETVP